jgi:hypothetical protein
MSGTRRRSVRISRFVSRLQYILAIPLCTDTVRFIILNRNQMHLEYAPQTHARRTFIRPDGPCDLDSQKVSKSAVVLPRSASLVFSCSAACPNNLVMAQYGPLYQDRGWSGRGKISGRAKTSSQSLNHVCSSSSLYLVQLVHLDGRNR